MKGFLGIIGGMGPLASSHLYQMIINKTNATIDQDNINMIIYNHASMPDRTAYILDNSKGNPLPLLKRDVIELESLGASLIIIVCNTAHYFYNELVKITNVPILNIIEDTVSFIKKTTNEKVLILATTGTLRSKLYQSMCKKYNVDYIEPDDKTTGRIMEIIYNIKSGKIPTKYQFNKILKNYKKNIYLLGCTELSILKSKLKLNDKFIDPLEIETEKIIKYYKE